VSENSSGTSVALAQCSLSTNAGTATADALNDNDPSEYDEVLGDGERRLLDELGMDSSSLRFSVAA
jgi:hypothetical protein